MLFSRVRTIDPAEAAGRLRRGDLLLVDVGEPHEVRQGRPDGSRNIPLSQLGTRLAELDTARRVAFVCHSGARSARAVRMAERAGIPALNVRGGLMAWSRAGLPLTR